MSKNFDIVSYAEMDVLSKSFDRENNGNPLSLKQIKWPVKFQDRNGGSFGMELKNQIKKYRMRLELSQEELAEKIYVTRQTISNWENGKSYPDIHSLLLLGSVFQLSLDQLVKGDLEIMKEKIKQEEVRKFNLYGGIYTVLLFVFIVSAIPLIVFGGIIGTIVAVVIYIIGLVYALKIEKIKKENDIQTYKEICAFMRGERLDEIKKKQESEAGKYKIMRNIIKGLCGAAAGFVVGYTSVALIKYFIL